MSSLCDYGRKNTKGIMENYLLLLQEWFPNWWVVTHYHGMYFPGPLRDGESGEPRIALMPGGRVFHFSDCQPPRGASEGLPKPLIVKKKVN